jgi:hypothetical protein
VVGICSIAAYFWFSFLTKESFQELCLDFFMAAFCLLVASKPAIGPFAIVLALGALAGWAYYARQTWKLGLEWIVVIVCGICWIVARCSTFTCRWPA